jgi:2-haloacid dehalogenase
MSSPSTWLATLFSLSSLQALLADAGGEASTLAMWFSRLLGDGFAITAAGDHRTFDDVAKASLRAVLPKAKASARDRVITGLRQLDAHADSAPAMGRAVEEARVIVLTNGSTSATETLLAHGRLDAFVEAVVSADDVRAWKPRADPYVRAAAVADVPPESVAMVTVHPWNVLGARRAGLSTGWCNREGVAFRRPSAERVSPGPRSSTW